VENQPVGKTEVWYIIDAAPDAKIGYGFSREVGRAEVESAIEAGTLEQFINYIDVKPGDVFFIPAGLVHCLCRGLLVAELQQNSNLTYRLYDYNRVTGGKKRELHIEKALDVCDFSRAVYIPSAGGRLCECEYFSLDKVDVKDSYTLNIGTFNIVFFLAGRGVIKYKDGEVGFKPGDTFLLPHSLEQCEICGECEILLC